MRVIFMGTPDFAVGTLEEIIKAGHEVVLVVSQPDKAVGRSKALRYTPVKACALEHGIEVYQPQKVRDSECIERLRTYHCGGFWADYTESDSGYAALRVCECARIAASEVSWCRADSVGGHQRRHRHRSDDDAYG